MVCRAFRGGRGQVHRAVDEAVRRILQSPDSWPVMDVHVPVRSTGVCDAGLSRYPARKWHPRSRRRALIDSSDQFDRLLFTQDEEFLKLARIGERATDLRDRVAHWEQIGLLIEDWNCCPFAKDDELNNQVVYCARENAGEASS